MADNFTANPGSGGQTFASDDILGVNYPRSKITLGADNVNDGDVSASNPMPVAELPLILTGAAAQTAVVNNILLASAGVDPVNTQNYRSASIQVNSTGTAGTYIFEQSNDGVIWGALPVFNTAFATGAPIIGAITATASTIFYRFPIDCNFIRLRIVTTITGGSIQAFSKIGTDPYSPAVISATSNAAANFLTTVSGTVAIGAGTAAIGSVGLNVPTLTADVASAAITTTTTTAAFTPTTGSSYIIDIPVTAVTGTNPTLDVVVQESTDSGTNWFDVYHFPRITATGSYRSTSLTLRGNRVRYIQTVGGTTPSFTRAINRLGKNDDAPIRVQFIDRTINPNSASSTTPAFFVEGCTSFNFFVRCGAGQTAAATLTAQFSHDGTNWHTTGNTLTTVLNGIAHAKVQNEQWKFARLNVTAAGTGVTLGEAMIVAASI
jgi:hypothetical protein